MKTRTNAEWENPSPIKNRAGRRSLEHFRGLQFLLSAWFLASGFPKPAGWEGILNNTSIAMTLTFLLSGFMAHYSNPSRGGDSVSQYVRRKLGVLFPLHALAVIWTLGLLVKEGCPSYFAVISNLLLVSSLSTFLPLIQLTSTPELQICPSLMIGSSLCVCWVVYPFFQRLKDRFFPVKSFRYVIFCGLVFLLPAVPGFIVLSEARSRQFSQVVVSAEKGVIGNATWFINPFFKVPIFLVGSMIADVVLNAGLGAAENEDTRDRKLSTIKDLLGGVVVDLMLVALTASLLFVPEARDQKSDSLFSWIGSSYYGLLGLNGYMKNVEVWNFTGWILSLPAAALLIFLFASPVAIVCQFEVLSFSPWCIPSCSIPSLHKPASKFGPVLGTTDWF